MRMRLPVLAVAASLMVLLSLSCGGDTATGGADAATGRDAGEVRPDTGGNPTDAGAGDTGAPNDAGSDTGTTPDSGTDVGSPTDAGGDDAGMPRDGGMLNDAGGDDGWDAGTPHDGGVDAGAPQGDGGGDAGVNYWTPGPGTTWQIQFSGTLDTSFDVQVYDFDLFDTPQATFDALKAAGRKVICYFSAGSYENWRPDKASFKASDYGKPLASWPGEWWLDVRSQNVRDIMAARMDLAVQKKCDGVDPDNVDGYQNDTGFPLSAADQEDYLRYLADAAHTRGLAIGLKNCLGLVPKVVSEYQWQINEECLAYNECADLKPFIDGGKAVFHIEYVNDASEGPAKKAEVCGDPTTVGFSTLIKTWDLSAWRLPCD